jgi:hypothetical protein
MDSTLKNVAVILVIFTLAFVGYYFFIQKDKTALGLDSGSINQDLFADVQRYIGRREVLDKVKLDTAIFKDERYNTLIDYTPEEAVMPEPGRDNPFDEV